MNRNIINDKVAFNPLAEAEGDHEEDKNPLGDVDYYVNGGSLQPSCNSIFDPQCSITASYKIIVEHYKVQSRY